MSRELSYIKARVAKNLEQDQEYRAAYNEEIELSEKATARRQAVMKQFAAIRKAHHLTQQQIAARLKISQERVSQMESGSETISVDRLLDLAAALGVKLMVVEENDVHRHGLKSAVIC